MEAPGRKPIRILGVSGSLRQSSFNRRLVRRLSALTPDEVEIVEFNELGDVEPFNEDSEVGVDLPGVEKWRSALRNSDAVIFATPEYNGSIPGQLKNALDWASRSDSDVPGLAGSALYGKPSATISSSTGQFGGIWAADELRKVLKTQGARIVDGPVVAVPDVGNSFDDMGRLFSSAIEERLTELIKQTAELVKSLQIDEYPVCA